MAITFIITLPIGLKDVPQTLFRLVIASAESKETKLKRDFAFLPTPIDRTG